MSSASVRSSSVESFKVMDVLRQANALSAAGHAVLHCEVGQPETGAPRAVAQAAVAALTSPHKHESRLGYTDAFGLYALREKISHHYAANYQELEEPPSPDRIVVTTGSSAGFLLAFTACFDVGDVVAIASSGYPCYRNILGAVGCRLATISVNQAFKLTADELAQEIDRRAAAGLPPLRGLILSSPSNPTGAMLTPDELRELCQLCDEKGITFLSDEIYHGISYGTPTATALQYTTQAVVINSFSKYYSMSGWRLGWMVLPESLIDAVNSLQQNMFINAPTISQTAALRCWDAETLEELEGHVAKYRTSRQIILDALAQLPGLHQIAPADGGFYVYVDVGETNVAIDNNNNDEKHWGTVRLCSTLLEEQHVAFTPGVDFEDPATGLGDRRFRISYAGGIDTAQQAMERFAKFWPTWQERVQKAKM